MSLELIAVLIVLMVANQIIGTTYGSWKEGFDKDLLCKGLLKILYLTIGYGALAVACHFAADHVPEAEYISGIIVEPIAKYFSKICEKLRKLLDDSVSEVVSKRKSKDEE